MTQTMCASNWPLEKNGGQPVDVYDLGKDLKLGMELVRQLQDRRSNSLLENGNITMPYRDLLALNGNFTYSESTSDPMTSSISVMREGPSESDRSDGERMLETTVLSSNTAHEGAQHQLLNFIGSQFLGEDEATTGTTRPDISLCHGPGHSNRKSKLHKGHGSRGNPSQRGSNGDGKNSGKADKKEPGQRTLLRGSESRQR